MASTSQLIDHLKKNPEGLRFVDIQRFVAETNGRDFDEMVVVNQWDVEQGAEPIRRRRLRGYWCDHLCDGMKYVQIKDPTPGIHGSFPRMAYVEKRGLLSKICDKQGKLYVLKKDLM